MEQVTSVLQRVKDENGDYIITLNYNTMDEVLESLETGRTLRQVNAEINDKQEGLLDDLATVIYNLAGLIDTKINLNQIYRENFKDQKNLSITSGQFEQGCVKCLSGENLMFSLKQPKELKFKPEKFKLRHIIKYTGTLNLKVDITFNALDNNPTWFNANNAITTDKFFEISEFEKEEGKPYAMNIKFTGSCDFDSSLEISDVMVMTI